MGDKGDKGDKSDKGERIDFDISWKTCLKLIISLLVLFLCMRYWGTIEGFVGLLLGGMLAIFAGLVISYIVNIPMRFFERKLPGPTGDGTRNRVLAIVLSVVCAVAVLLIVGILVIPNLVQAVITLAESVPGVVESISKNEFLSSLIPAPLLAQLKTVDWHQLVNDAVGWLQSGVVSSLPQIMTLFGQIGAWFMGIILAFWFLSEKDKLSKGVHTIVKTYIGKGADENFSRAIAVADKCFHGYFVGAALEACILGGLVAIACTIAGMPQALMLGALVGIMALIPMIGALIGALLGAVIILATSWQHALIFLILFFIVQQIEANFIYPRVVGKHVGLTGLWPLIGITLGVALFGFVGAFVGVPLTATVFSIVKSDLARRKELSEDGPSPLEKLHKTLSD